MADNNFFFKVLAELSDTEYFTFYFFPLTGGGEGPFETLPKSYIQNENQKTHACLREVLDPHPVFLHVVGMCLPGLVSSSDGDFWAVYHTSISSSYS